MSVMSVSSGVVMSERDEDERDEHGDVEQEDERTAAAPWTPAGVGPGADARDGEQGYSRSWESGE